ncbi:MAG: PilZ domain-containing protein [Enterobacterales bacterium]|nr:PilZ domain-containing protein [Enterobacterales bacterium]
MKTDKRKHPRQEREETIFIEVLAASSQNKDDNILLECTTKDISKSGLKITAEYPFIIDSILELIISFESGGYKFLLTGQVKWYEEVSDKRYIAGFELIEAEHSDFMVWRNMFDEEQSLQA